MAKKKNDVEPIEDGSNERMFLGALRSEFDTQEELAEEWLTLSNVTQAIKRAYSRFDLTPQETAAALSEVTLKDQGGSFWRVGATSNQWYRKLPNSEKWIKSPAPAVAVPARNQSPAWLTQGASALIGAAGEDEPAVPLPSGFLPPVISEEDEAQAEVDSFLTTIGVQPLNPENAAPVSRSGVMNAEEFKGWAPTRRVDSEENPSDFAEQEIDEVEVVPFKKEPTFAYSGLLEGLDSPRDESKDEPLASEPADSLNESEEVDDLDDFDSSRFYRPDN